MRASEARRALPGPHAAAWEKQRWKSLGRPSEEERSEGPGSDERARISRLDLYLVGLCAKAGIGVGVRVAA